MKTDSPHILCINPWIHDFAAFDFWAKPLGLLSIAAILREKGLQVSFIDCLDRFHPKESKKIKVFWDGRGPFRKTQIDLPKGLENYGKKFSRYGIKPQWFAADLKKIKKPDLIFITSLMTYWATGVKETIEMVKETYPDVPVILGGIYASLCYEHANKDTLADLVVKGPGEQQLKKIIKDFTGFEFEDSNLSGALDELPFPALDLQNKIAYAPILTSRGCPFSCEYCASSYLEPEIRRRSPENVFREIEHWHKNFNIQNFAFYDDALLVNSKLYAFPLFEKIIASKMDVWFHTPNALHIKEITKQAASLMFMAGFKTIRLGLETTDFSKNRNHDAKVMENDFYAAVENLKAAGFEKKQIGAYLLCGLPEQNFDEVEISMYLVKQTGIQPVLAYYTPIPHTPMWERAVKYSKLDLLEHPVFTNNTLFPCVNSEVDLKRISQLKNL
ncbi:MAG: cobalamin-dependent protein [Desulfobacterales bacterium]|nr:cobalamin-dependent protein [Desulfobacterales bacterium]